MSGRAIGETVLMYTDEDCEGALLMAKWPAGYRCPRCANPRWYDVVSRGRKLYECRSCGHQTSLTAGTILEGTRTPLRKWFQAMHLMQSGISAKLLAELISVTYKTAWLINHKLRHAIDRWDRELPLEGNLQLLGEFYGYEYLQHISPSSLPEAAVQPVVLGAAVSECGDIAHLKIKKDSKEQPSRSTEAETLDRFVRQHTSDANVPRRVAAVDRRRNRGTTSRLPAVWQGVVRWLARTFGGIGPKHLQAYLNEFCFRYLLRRDLLVELIGMCGATRTITYPDLTGNRAGVQAIRWRRHAASRGARRVS